MNKQNLRQQMRGLRAALSPDERGAASVQVGEHLRQLCLQQNWSSVAAYLATSEEVNLDNFIGWLLKRGINIYTPCGEGFALTNDLENVTIGYFGVREPKNEVIALPDDVVFLIPGLAFDKQGGRLGFGGGWYDRALLGYQQALKIGIAFDCQIVDQVPCEAHDVKMDVMITPSAIIECKMQH